MDSTHHPVPVPSPEDAFAIVGIGCRLPGGASDYRTFWRNLLDGKDCITDTPADRYDTRTLASRDKAKPGRLVGGRGGYIDGFDEFDPAFFGISPREAEHMDPQQRKLLEVAWEALEDGGLRPGELAGTDVGVYVGAFTLDYKILQFADLSFETLASHTATGTMMTMVSNRISYCFDFRGPSVSVDTACSGSLVAVHLACQSLRRGETSVALAGGTLLHMAPQYTIAETKGGFLSPDGRSRTLDAAANGYVRAEGVGMIAIKRLADAQRDGDPIHAVIIGSGVNQDGRTNGITVPNPDAQVSLIERVCTEAGITPGSLQYVEAHGTSTPVGDPLEANALARALAIGREPGAETYVGSVKTNIGHTEAAAGVAGLIKTVLSLKHRIIPPHINLETVNPQVDEASLPYRIPREPTAWPAHSGPARAGVNSFGFGGTNAHVLLQEAPPVPEPAETAETAEPAERDGYHVLPLTARDPQAFAAQAAGLRERLATGTRLTDAAYTLAHRRQHLDQRLSLVYDSPEALDEVLAAVARGESHPHAVPGTQREGLERRLVWVFTGMGPQWWAMGRQLYATEPVYREVIDRCDREIAALTGWSLTQELNADEADSRMSETWLAQPANFAVQIALAALWRSKGVRPDAITGHSTGEVAAFYEAGVYTLPEAVRIVVHRSRLQQKLIGTGSMLAVSLTEAEAARRVRPHGDRVSLAAVNSPTSVTLAGDTEALERIAAELGAEDVFARFLEVGVPYHSPRMELIKDELLTSLADLKPQRAKLPLYLTAEPGAVAQGTELDAGYWWRNVREAVHFRAAVDRLLDDGYGVFLEIGPHPVLAHSLRECCEARDADSVTLASIRRKADERERFTLSLAALHGMGFTLDWHALHPAGRTVELPRYPFRRDRYWVEPPAVAQIRLGHQDHPLLGRRTRGAEPVWEVKLDAEAAPYLEDHRIQGTVLFPAAGYLEMAAQAMRALTGGADSTAALADIELRKALFLPDGEPRTVQLSFSSDAAAFSIATVGAEPTVHATGTVRAGQRRTLTAPLDTAAVRSRAVRHLAGPDCYAQLAALGYHYGPAFQGIEEVWIGEGEALARIRPPEGLGEDAAAHHMHPVLLDSCFQSLLTPQLLTAPGDPEGTGIRLPLSIAEVRMDPVGDRELWVHATVTGDEDGELTGDIAVYDGADGTPLGRVAGFRAADVEKAATTVGLSTIDSWLTEPSWVPCPLPETAEPVRIGGRLVLLADAGGLAERLAALIGEAGGEAYLVRPGGGYALDRAARTGTVDPGSTDELGRLLAELAPVDGVVHLWNLDRPALADAPRERFGELATTGAYSVIALARALLAAPDTGAATAVHVVTRAAQPVVPGDAVEPLGAPAWGIGRVLWQQELTGRGGKLIDLAADGAPEDDALALLRELADAGEGAEREDEIAVRAGVRHTSRLVPAEGLSRPLPLRLRADGSYLVTGAFGALGRLLCRTLVKRGARRLILVGRTRLPERERWADQDPGSPAGRHVRFLKELEALGAQPILAPLDITDEDALAGWLAGYRRAEGPPIRGVFHLAGQVRDTLVPEMERDVFDAVHDPKVVGAALLHRQLSGEPLEHFVLFASVAAWLTTAGQTNYAAGNAFLDALAHHRRSQGLPALSLDWGPWATGMIEELGLIEHYRNSRGMSSLAPEAGMAVLERVIGQDRAQLLVATVVDWPVFMSWYAEPPRLVTDLARAAGDAVGDGDGGSFLDAFRQASPDKRMLLLTERFTTLVAQVLRVRAEQVDPAVSLNLLGLDSLLAMELRARVVAEVGIALPVVALLSSAPAGELITQLHEGLLELLAEEGEGTAATAVERYEDESAFPLTQNQQALWFLKQLNPDGFAYNIGGAVEVRVELDPDLMFEAFRRLLARHPVLRANFVLVEGKAVQRISPEIKEDVALFEVEDRDWDDIYQMIIHEYRKPYDLAHDPLIRFRLFRRGPDRWVITKAVHHIISDAISTFTFIEELLALYEGMRRGQEVELPPVAARYLDFLNWQNQFLAGREARKMLDYWRGQLPDEVPVLALPTDKPRPAVLTHNGASEFFALDAELSARVHALAREHNVTVFMVLLSAYYLLLHRYAGQDDIIVGSPVTGRTQEEFGAVYGYFVNPLPLHVSLAGDPSVAELLDRVRTTVLGGLDNQEYPFTLLVEQLGLAHDPSRSAVFQAMFILLHHKVATEKYGYKLEYIELPEEEGQFDLTLSAYEEAADGRFHCVFKYNTDLFEPETMRRLAGHYQQLLHSLTHAQADATVSGLPMLSGGERHRILTEWSGAAHTGGREHPPVPRLIAEAARRAPEAVAVAAPAESGPTRQLTYGELEARAAELAAALRARGVGAGTVVALCLEKSPELIIALLAVLKAGGAYLPLDPDYPADRLAYMVRHAGAALVIGGRDTGAGLPGPVVTVEELLAGEAAGDGPAPAAGADSDPDPDPDPDSPAYVIYTSGSTGRPKAVAVSHRNLAAAYAGWRTEYGLEDGDVRTHLQMAGPAFDVFTGDLTRALCSGGTLVLIGRELLFNTARLYAVMRAEAVDCGEFVPAVARTLIRHCENSGERLDFLRLLIVGSDSWKAEEYERLRALGAGRLVNSYGLTEATIDSSWFEGPADTVEGGRMVPIGRPFPGSALYILDGRGEPVPPGVPGELWIGGDGVALGYLGDPELTAERFLTRTLDGERPVRLYRTGDLAHWDAAGTVHLLGRADSQIKVRGHRIEIGEIESHLAAYPALAQAQVTVRPDAGGENVLCAYGVPAPGAELDWRDVRQHLADYLPTFMIPTHFTTLTELPLTPNGKVDVAALPAPGGDTGSGPAYEAPVTLYETRMADHWQRLLGIEAPGPGLAHDFFESGGSSIRLIELIYHLQAEFGISIPVSRLFQVTTLHGMAKTVERIVTGEIEGSLPYLRFNEGAGQAVFCFPPAGGHGLVYRAFAAQLPEHDVIAFNYLMGEDKVARYADLVVERQPSGALDLLGYSLGGNLAFEVAKELEERGRTVRHVVIVDSLRVEESYELGPEHLAVFERELAEHLHKHTGSALVAEKTREQAKDYLEFTGRTANPGSTGARISVISDEENHQAYAGGAEGSWHGASRTGTEVLRGVGRHADMLDPGPVEHNARLARAILTGGDEA
ncbi:amino acid adenylation domain-containing protein [Streptomyces carpaticus]|uniref:amino acid adenylation domain-containing protein n=1 Tax=Streptomyces carpaticus TaxID=285558 RepID=UPI003D2F8921